MILILLAFLVLSGANVALTECPATSSHFCYQNNHESHCVGPDCWYAYGQESVSCGTAGIRQSPIDIVTSSLVEDNEIQVKLTANTNIAQGGTLTNTGHSVQLNLNSDSNGEYRYKIEAVTENDFKIVQLHFHYGTANDKGSEHMVDNGPFSGEMHAVGVYQNELAVLGFFLQVSSSNTNNTELGKLVQYFGDVKNKDDTHTITDFDLKAFVADNMNANEVFYRYLGSLTTPPCSEIVTWTVFAKPIQLSQEQMDDFRSKVVPEPYCSNNFRPVQNGNNENMVVYKGVINK